MGLPIGPRLLNSPRYLNERFGFKGAAMFIHTVFFWTKAGTTGQQHESLIKDCYDYLGKVPTVNQLWAGKPAMTPRDVVDNSYQVGLTVVLNDSPGHDIYQKHDLHMQFIERNKAIWERVQVYDYIPGA
jgi:hypothetical protein